MKPWAATCLAGLAALLTMAASPSPAPPISPSPSPSASPSPSPSPSPTPAPSSGQLNLSPAGGPPGETITVSGSRFRPAEAITIFWDNRDHSLGGATADAQGGFSIQVKAPDDPAGQHAVCALEPNQVCGTFQLQARATPSPSPSATATATPVPAGDTSPAPTGGFQGQPSQPDSGRVSAISLLLQPPLVIVPIVLLAALLAASVFWIRAGARRTGPGALAGATVRHRANSPAGIPEAQPPSPPLPPPPPPVSPPAPAAMPGPEAGPPPRPRPTSSDEPPDLPLAGD